MFQALLCLVAIYCKRNVFEQRVLFEIAVFYFLSLQVLIDSCTELDIKHHKAGTMVSVEGPRFSSLAESKMFRQWGGSTINMTTCPEVCLIITSQLVKGL